MKNAYLSKQKIRGIFELKRQIVEEFVLCYMGAFLDLKVKGRWKWLLFISMEIEILKSTWILERSDKLGVRANIKESAQIFAII